MKTKNKTSCSCLGLLPSNTTRGLAGLPRESAVVKNNLKFRESGGRKF